MREYFEMRILPKYAKCSPKYKEELWRTFCDMVEEQRYEVERAKRGVSNFNPIFGP